MVRIIVNGICGQMGRVVVRTAQAMGNAFAVVAGVDQRGGMEVDGVPVYGSYQEIQEQADVVVDFSIPGALPAVLDYCQDNGLGAVICTTGLGEKENRLIQAASQKVPVFQSGNMSLGVNLQIELIKKAAATLGDGFDVEIIEQHHNRKIDSPSGTALMLANALASQYPNGRELVFGRHSKNQRRTPTEIGIHAIRGGTIVGEHKVEFIGQDEMLVIEHKAYSKQVFAVGALRAAQYLCNKEPGIYNMHDVVTEQNVLSHLYTEDNQSIVTLSSLPHEAGIMDHIFGAIAKADVYVDMISMAAPGGACGDVSFSLPSTQLATALNALKPLRSIYRGMDVHALDNITKLTVEGPGMALRHGVAAQLFSVLCAAQVNIELVTTSETKIACCVATTQVPAAVSAIAKHFSL